MASQQITIALAWFTRLAQRRRDHRVVGDALVSTGVGLLTLLALLVLQPPTLSVVRRGADDTADKMMRLAQEVGGAPRVAPGYTFVTVDERTWTDWNYPLVTPRDRLAELVSVVARSGPLAIILDVDLAYPDTAPGEAALRAALDSYDDAGPPLLLVRALLGTKTAEGALPPQRPTVYDAAVARHPNIMWTAPLFLRDGDGRVRRWRLVVPSCAGAQPAMLPSTHLVAAAMVRAAAASPAPGAALAGWQALRDRLATLVPPTCQGPAPTREAILVDANATRLPIRLDGTDVASRVLYATRWTDNAVALGPLAATPAGPTPLVRVQPAGLVLGLPAGDPVPGLTGRVVLIGGSYGASGDWFETPLGRMPGALALLNATDALAENGTPQEPPLAERAAVSVVIILAVSLLTSLFRPFVATLLSALAVFLVMLASLPHFRSGVVLDMAVPAVAAALTDFVTSAIERIRDLSAMGAAWIFKPTPAPSAAGPTGEPPAHGSAP